MLIGVSATGPTLVDPVDPVFGRCRYLVFVDPDTMEFEAVENPGITAVGGAGTQAARLLAARQVAALVTGNVGPNAKTILDAANIDVITGVSGSIRDAAEGFRTRQPSPRVVSAADTAPESAAEPQPTRICVTTMGNAGLDELVGQHFGRVPTYTFVDGDTGQVIEIVPNTSMHMGGEGYAPDLISAHGGNVMLCGGLGRRAVDLFEKKGITVHVGASGTVKQAIEQWKAGKLQLATSDTACREHAFRDEELGHGRHHHHHRHGCGASSW